MNKYVTALLGGVRRGDDGLPGTPIIARGSAIATLALSVAFALGVVIGLQLHFPSSLVYFIWPPSVILFVALLLTPRRVWWVYLLALFPVHMLLEWWSVAAPPLSLALFYGVVWVQALVGALTVARLATHPFEFTGLRALIAFFLGAAAAALAEAMALTFVLGVTARGTNISLTFVQTFFADSLTMITLGPVLVIAGSTALRAWRSTQLEARDGSRHITNYRDFTVWAARMSRARLLEASLLGLGVLGIGLAAFGGYLSVPGTLPALLYSLLPLLLWAAMRFGLTGTSLATCGLTFLSILFAIHMRGPFSTRSYSENLLSLQLVFIAVSVPMLVLAVIIQERQRSQADLRQSEDRYRAVVSNFPYGAVLLFGADLRHLFADGQGLPIVGLSKASIEGRTLWEAFPAGVAGTLEAHYRAALSGSSSEFDLIHQGRTYQTQVVPIKHGATPTGMVLLQDVTEQRRAELLAEVDRAKTAFFSNVSHEFRTPLTLLLGPATDALADLETPLPSQQRQRLELILRNGERLQKLVNSLLDFARIESDTIQANYKLTDLATFTSDLASTFRSAIERVGLDLVVYCEPRPHLAYVDRDMWEKIVLNLLSNALKFTFYGQITIRLRTVDDQIELQVEDTGTGIPATDLPHIFERFYRAPHARARTQEGTGIGLTLVQELVRLHGGAVRVESTAGSGSTFTVRVPCDTTQVPSEPIDDAPLEAPAASSVQPYVNEAHQWARAAVQANVLPRIDVVTTGQSSNTSAIDRLESTSHPSGVTGLNATPELAAARILVADDNADLREYLARILGTYWQVDTAPSGASALARARERPPDLVLADVMMPDMDGFKLMRALRADPATGACPVVLLSARAGEEAVIEGLDAGADDYLVKPFAPRELVARVRTHLELAHLRRQAVLHARQLDAIFHAITAGIFVFDAAGDMAQVNAAAQSLLEELRASEFVQIGPAHTIPVAPLLDDRGEPHAPSQLPVSRLLQGEVLSEDSALNLLVPARDGGIRTIQVTGSPVRDQIGQITAAVAVCRDITAPMQMEADLRRAKEAAEAARVAAESATLHEEQRRRAAETLRDVMAILNSEHTLEDVLDFITQQAAALLESQAAVIYRVPATPDGVVALSSFSSYRGSPAPALKSYLPLSTAAMNHMLLVDGAIAIFDTSRPPEILSSIGPRDKLAPAPFVVPLEASFGAVLAGPIIVRGELYAGLALLYQQPRSFTPDECMLTSILCDQVAIAIENANLRMQAMRVSVLAERTRIARELHDAVTQTLFSASLVASALPDIWEANPAVGHQGLDNLRLLTRTALAEMRTLLVELRPAALTEKPLGDLLRQLAEAMSTRAQAAIAVEVKPGAGAPLPATVQIALYRIAQEALNNASKYAHARHVRIQLRTSGARVILRIDDDGEGFSVGPVNQAGVAGVWAGLYEGDGQTFPLRGLPSADRGMPSDEIGSGRSGITIMRERARSVGASFALRSRPGRGTLIVVRWPENGGIADAEVEEEENESDSNLLIHSVAGADRTERR